MGQRLDPGSCVWNRWVEIATNTAPGHVVRALIPEVSLRLAFLSLRGTMEENLPPNAGDVGSIPGSGKIRWRRKW